MASNQRHCFDCNSLSVSRRFLMNIAMFGLNFSNPKKAIESSENSWLLLSSKVSSEVLSKEMTAALWLFMASWKEVARSGLANTRELVHHRCTVWKWKILQLSNHFRLFIAKHLEHKQARSSLQGSDSRRRVGRLPFCVLLRVNHGATHRVKHFNHP